MIPAKFFKSDGWRLLPPMAISIVAALIFNYWVTDPAHFFFADDWGWLNRAQFQSWRETIHLLPEAVYNDRPVGELVIRGLYRLFWLRVDAWNQIWLLLHALNVALLVLLARPWLPPNRLLLAGVLGACWFSALTAVHWVGAVFDLLGATLVLGAVLSYQHAVLRAGRRWFWLVLAFLLHFAAIRTKEFAVGMFAVFVVWEVVLLRSGNWKDRLVRLAPHAFLAGFFVVKYLALYQGQREALHAGDYGLSWSLSGVLNGVAWYFAQAFYAFVPGSNETFLGIGAVFLVFVTLIACCSRIGIAAFLSAAALMAAVLLLGKQRHPLYLYVPHFFIAIALCGAFPKRRVVDWISVALTACLLLWPVSTGFLRDARNFTLLKGEYSKTLFYDYARQMQHVKPDLPLTIVVSDPYFDPFSWGNGDAVRIYHGDRTIKVNVVPLQQGQDACAATEGLCFIERGGRLIRER